MIRGAARSGGPPGGGSMRAQAERAEKAEKTEKTEKTEGREKT
jgi:hypothetical protein